jgi:hypothetical protein
MENSLLYERIGRLKQWKPDEPLNEILYNALSSLNDNATERFNRLTQEIKSEVAVNENIPVIKVAVFSGEDADKQVFLHPVAANDERPYGDMDYLSTVFAGCDYTTIQKMMGKKFKAEIQSAAGSRQIQVGLRYSKKYLNKQTLLYHTFAANNLPWVTINSIYFYKFLDVYSVNDEDMRGVDIIHIHFEEYNEHLSHDKTLLWNIEPMVVPTSWETKPAYNKIVYEHSIKGLKVSEHQYLVCPIDDEFRSYKQGQMMYVRTHTKKFGEFELLRIISGNDVGNPLFLPTVSNGRREGLVNSLAFGRHLPTKGEAQRIVRSINAEIDMTLEGIEVLPASRTNLAKYNGINFNPFVEANRFITSEKMLLFKFKSKVEPLWAHEAMFYLLSELQLYFYEHRVVGEMI